MDAKKTGELVARRRREQGLSQAELAERLHISDKTVSKWETGRGMPGIDLLEALGETLGLSVSELLSGQRLTPEELPKAAGKQLVSSIKRENRRLWQGIFLAALAVVFLLAGRVGFHYFTSVDAGDRAGLARAADRYLSQWDENRRADPSVEVVATQRRGDYLAALCTRADGSFQLCVYERNRIFPDRYRAGGGKPNLGSGELDSWNYGNSQEAVIIFCGGNLPQEARFYTFANSGIAYTCPIRGDLVLDIFLLPDTGDISSYPEELLDENHQVLDWEPSAAAVKRD